MTMQNSEVRACSLRTHREYLFELRERRGCCGVYSIDDEGKQWLLECSYCPSDINLNSYVDKWLCIGVYKGVYLT